MKGHATMKIKEQSNLLVAKIFYLQSKKSTPRKSENWVHYHQMPLKCNCLLLGTILYDIIDFFFLLLDDICTLEVAKWAGWAGWLTLSFWYGTMGWNRSGQMSSTWNSCLFFS